MIEVPFLILSSLRSKRIEGRGRGARSGEANQIEDFLVLRYAATRQLRMRKSCTRFPASISASPRPRAPLDYSRLLGMAVAQADTKDLDALLAALNRSAERLQTLWFTFLFITMYFAITALTTTHRMLLLNTPQKLPVIGMEVPLLPFYVIAPMFYVVIHFYVLMMLVLLARTTQPFEEKLREAFPVAADRERYRARSENALFLQMLIGPEPERKGFNGRMLAIIALITLALAPLVVLLLMQMMFLPYHSFRITWLHRATILLDFVLVVTLWTSYRYHFGQTQLTPLFLRREKPLGWAVQSVAHVLGFLLLAWASLWEGRWAGEDSIASRNYAATANGVMFGLFPDRLRLVDEIVVGEKLLEEKKKEMASRGDSEFIPTFIFDGRDLQAAVLSGADLRGVALRLARLQGADLKGASLQSANLEGA